MPEGWLEKDLVLSRSGHGNCPEDAEGRFASCGSYQHVRRQLVAKCIHSYLLQLSSIRNIRYHLHCRLPWGYNGRQFPMPNATCQVHEDHVLQRLLIVWCRCSMLCRCLVRSARKAAHHACGCESICERRLQQ